MYSVNLDSIKDFSQISVQNSGQNASEISKDTSNDFLSLLNESLNKLNGKKEVESVKKDSAAVERKNENFYEKSDTPKEIAEKPVSENKKETTAEERSLKTAGDEKVEDKVAKQEDEGRGKSLKADGVLQSTVFAKTLGGEKAASTKDARTRSLEKIDSKNNLKVSVEGQLAKDEASIQEQLRIGLAKKNFIDEAKGSLRENSENGSGEEILSANELLSAMQYQSVQRTVGTENANAKDLHAEAKNVSAVKGKKESKIGVIEVKDLRTKIEAAAGEQKELKKDFVRAVKEESNGNVELTMHLGEQSEKNILSLDSQSAAADGSTFQAMLKNQITQNAGDLVRAGNIVLKDNNAGSINLVLHPEELGNVKIGLELTGKTITGHIIVASREAFNAFGDGADVLRNAFIQSGFEDAHFDVTYAGSEMQFAQQNNSGAQDGSNAHQQGRKIYGEFVEENDLAISQNADTYIDTADYSVDIVA